MRFAERTHAQRNGDDRGHEDHSTVGKLTLKEQDTAPTVGNLRLYEPPPWSGPIDWTARNDDRPLLPPRNPDGSVPRLDLGKQRESRTSPIDQNLEHLRANIDAALEKGEVEQQLAAALRPLVDQVVGKLHDGPSPTAVRVAWNDKEYFSSEHLSGGTTGHPRVESDEDVFAAVMKDLGLGLLGGLVAAGLDYVRFEHSVLAGNVPEYRAEQVGTQIEIGSLLTDVGGTGSALAYAALQWCFTNDLLFYAIAYLHDSKQPNWNDTRDGVKQLVSGQGNGITWASWSLLGLLTGTGTEANPMSFPEALVQGALLGPLLALGLALVVEKLGLQDLAGGLVSVSLDTGLERALDRDAIVQALCVRLKIPPVQAIQLIAKVAPLTGDISGTRATGVIQMSDEIVTAFVGCGIDFQQAGTSDQGKTIAHGQTTSLVCGIEVDGKPVSLQVSAKLPIDQSWKDNDKQPLSRERQDELHVADGRYNHDLERIAFKVDTGPVDIEAEVRTSVALQEMFAGLGFQWQAGRFTLGGDAWLVTGVRRHPDVGFSLNVRVRF